MIRISFTAEDLLRTRLLSEPAPLVELKLTLMMLRRSDREVFFGRWRRNLNRTLPPTTRPLWDLVTAFKGAPFLDPLSVTLDEGLEAVRSAPRSTVQRGLEVVYGKRPGAAPGWLTGLLHHDSDSWQLLIRAQRDAFDGMLSGVSRQLQERHRSEFARYAIAVAGGGLEAGLTQLIPGSRLAGSVWTLDAPYSRRVELGGRGLVMIPTFHWTDAVVFADTPGKPVIMAYPAGTGIPVVAADSGDALAAVVGRTRADVLRLLDSAHSTSEVSRKLGISLGSASEHAASLRQAGLISTERDGRAARHCRTALGSLLAGT